MNFRLDPQPLEWIDRSQQVGFRFEGKQYTGFKGDSISAALLASGQQLLGRSFKYHRPRSALSFANHDVNALFQSDEATNIRGDVVGLSEGMELRACNVNGSLEHDRDTYIGLLSRFLPVGFYYKAFHKPKKLFPLWERIIREKAGLGSISTDWSAQRQAKQYRITSYNVCYTKLLRIGVNALSTGLTFAGGKPVISPLCDTLVVHDRSAAALTAMDGANARNNFV